LLNYVGSTNRREVKITRIFRLVVKGVGNCGDCFVFVYGSSWLFDFRTGHLG